MVRLSLYGPIVAVRLRANLEAHSWTNDRPVMAHSGPSDGQGIRQLVMSDVEAVRMTGAEV